MAMWKERDHIYFGVITGEVIAVPAPGSGLEPGDVRVWLYPSRTIVVHADAIDRRLAG